MGGRRTSDFGTLFHLSWLEFPSCGRVRCANVTAQTREWDGMRDGVASERTHRHGLKVYGTAETLRCGMERNPIAEKSLERCHDGT